jgi:uncharacterized membrane protein YgdD (TMEM256/DUF423 family)
LLAGALLAALSVIFGAFGAHSLENHISTASLNTFETAARYQMYHSVGLILLFLIQRQIDAPLLNIVGYLFLTGIILFSGSLYLLVLTDTKWLGAITPLGGVAFILGWILMAFAAWRS